LPGHGDAEPLVRVDEVVVVVVAEVDLHPSDLAGEPAGAGGVVETDRCARPIADVGGLIAEEDHRLGRGDTALADRFAVMVVIIVSREQHRALSSSTRERWIGQARL